MVKDLTARKFRRVRPWTRGVNRENLKSTMTFTRDESIKPTILSVGRISKEKGLADLIPLQNDYDIIIVGDGPYREELQSKMPNAKFPGYKTGEELANYYAMADVFVFPSVTDTFGLVMIEAMSQGAPVAAYSVCGPIDVIDDGVTGCMDDDLNVAIKRCLELNRDSVREASEKWSWESCWKMFKDSLVPVKICDYEA
jgi:glycosyltransferase involved in cell wall biosynthesis